MTDMDVSFPSPAALQHWVVPGLLLQERRQSSDLLVPGFEGPEEAKQSHEGRWGSNDVHKEKKKGKNNTNTLLGNNVI